MHLGKKDEERQLFITVSRVQSNHVLKNIYEKYRAFFVESGVASIGDKGPWLRVGECWPP